MNNLNQTNFQHTELQSFFARLETDRSFYKKKEQSTLPVRIFRTVFQAVEQIAPDSAKRWGEKLFFTPQQLKLKDGDHKWINQSRKIMIDFDNELLPVLAWGNQNDPTIIFVHGWAGRPTDFSAWIEPLISQGFQVVAAEGPAHGKSNKQRTSLPELAEFILKVSDSFENINGYVGHSLGGSVISLALEMGLDPKPVIFINTPADPDGILNVFLGKIEGSQEIGNHIRDIVKDRYGKPFHEFSAIHTAGKMPKLPVFIIHDRYDREAPIYHFEELRKVLPWSDYLVTENLGHTRILQNEDVVNRGVGFMITQDW